MDALTHFIKRCLLCLFLVVMFSFSDASLLRGQDTIFSVPQYVIKFDSITKIDTTYIIDTVITTYTEYVYDTIYFSDDSLSEDRELFNRNYHKFECDFGITLNQMAITHWAAGGESNGSGKLSSRLNYSYHRKIFKYDFDGIFVYGMSSYAKDKRYEKTEDRCEISMTMSHNNNHNLTFTALASLKTQFSDGYSYPNDSVPISGFFSPAYLNLSAGYNLNIKDFISIYMSPIAGRLTFVTNQNLADAGAFGVEKAYWNVINGDSTFVKGKNILSELGINILIKYKQKIGEDISIFSNLNLYNNYMDPNKDNRWNIDVDWETGVQFNINKRISAVVNIHLIYDDNIKFTVKEMVNGVEITHQRPILQFKESLGISFLYKFASQ